MKMPDRNMINQQHTWAVAPGTFGFCPGGTDHRSRDRRIARGLLAENGVSAGRLDPFKA
jgi:hypothetical protein